MVGNSTANNNQKKNGSKVDGRRFVIWGLNAGIVAMCVVFVIMVYGAVVEYYDTFCFHYDDESFYWKLENEDYGNLVDIYHYNEAAGVSVDPEYHAVAEYIEAASFCKAYADAGQTEKAAKYAAQMEQAIQQMGSLSVSKEAIDAHLGLDK
ncbi:MAG: hypothetical protein II994_08970 [Lachnospiraceae bacterium]|nr:hypothetical protein [Lachnospiraceae bacterium]